MLGVKPEQPVIPGLTPSVETKRGIDLEYEPEGEEGMNFMSRTFPVLPFKETQGSALRKIKGSPVLVICETLGAQHVICIKKT